ncbi:hypothetical protein N7520_006714 [Penicillium odoratum]|uniref:uncharacterized protein n=1 Tax=Penicillium odoratum TaxID=1167516 RepID=UPI0025474BDB|nr:uncharacterized protein N7520_006714 [Penicillium odoratum]KAJ5759558.1 hypothetical protein N7520_006714 [Penicillium odoratum]
MATVDDVDPVIYPAFCFKASPTHFAWVKMAVADVHRLQKPRNFEVAGVIVARTDVFRRTILTLDDSSGATIEVVVLHSTDPKHTELNSNIKSTTTHASGSILKTQTQTEGVTGSQDEIDPDPNAYIITGGSTVKDKVLPNQPVHISATDQTILDIAALVPGTTIKIKGTLGSFRSIMQLQLERFTILRDTNAEMAFVFERLQFLVEVLSVPWVLLDEEIEQLRREGEEGDIRAAEERERARKKIKRREEREEKDGRQIARKYKAEERKREKEAGVCREHGLRVMEEIQERKRSYKKMDSA